MADDKARQGLLARSERALKARAAPRDGLSLDNLGWISQTARKAAHRLGFPNWDGNVTTAEGERYDGNKGTLRR
jgi:hypothetical protein